MRKIITIDGPSGVGKGTISQQLANDYGLAYLDSGALYRLSALQIQQQGLQNAPVEQQLAIISGMDIHFETGEELVNVYLNNHLVGDELRLETTAQLASQMASKIEIRQALLSYQRQFGGEKDLVADGRDMGTVVFPQASLKIFLDADASVRAQRRYKQLIAKGENVTLRTLEKEIVERDKRDRNRLIAPLKPASDAVVIDTTELSVNEVLVKIKDLYHQTYSI